ncbi:MAG TPA: four helix bundle protein [Vicinamibacterales bacterium]|nr:four helix bundle protein [Vicinamibacterales bacterium]
MQAKARALQARTHLFFVRTIRFCQSLPDTPATSRISGQLVDAAGAADSNYRAACRGRSTREFIAKIGVAAEEADECIGWLQALLAARIGDAEETSALLQEANELTAIFAASEKTARRNQTVRDAQERSSRRRNRT